MHKAKILADSISYSNTRLTTFELTYPRIVHGEMMTHRMFSRNAASSRAIPVKKMLKMIEENPYIPTHWGKNQRGMQAKSELTESDKNKARSEWLRARDKALKSARELMDIGLHKQITNRLLEPFQWYTIICTATEWTNFFHLRNHPEAHPEIKAVAELMEAEYNNNAPKFLSYDKWHAPLLNIGMDDEEEQIIAALGEAGPRQVSVGRCARVSYLTHDGQRDFNKDVELHDRLLGNGHMSPLEHVATPYDQSNEEHQMLGMCSLGPNNGDVWFGNFRNWVQYRKLIPGESDLLGHLAKQ